MKKIDYLKNKNSLKNEEELKNEDYLKIIQNQTRRFTAIKDNTRPKCVITNKRENPR